MFDFDNYCLKDEVWKDIPNFEGYQASNLGRIRTVEGKKTFTERHGIRIWKGKILKNKTKTPAKSGYMVSVWKNGKPHDLLVARLVCSAFYGMPDDFLEKTTINKMTVNHKDGNRYNNKCENLEWLSIKENIKHAFDTGLMTYQKTIMLINKEKITKHKSYADASRFLGKNDGYVSGQIKRKQKIYSVSGEEYEVYESTKI